MNTFIRKAVGVSMLSTVAACATHATAIPPFLAYPFSQQNIHDVASIRYEDASGHTIGENEFAAQLKQDKGFVISKSREDGLPDVTVRLQSTTHNPFSRLAIGDTLPEFHLTRLDGHPVDNKSLEGKYTLVNFYFAASETSLKQVPLLNAVAERRKDVNLLAITFDSVADTRAFVEAHGLTWPIVADADKLIKDIGEKAYPTMALFDPKGRLVDVYTGVGRLAYPAMFDAWLDKKMGAADRPMIAAGLPTTAPGQRTTAAVIHFRTCPAPVYPIAELQARHTGTVTLNFLVSSDGYVKKAEIRTSSGFPGLDQAAMVALVRCRFTPASSAGIPVEKWSPVQYVWSIR